MAPAGGGDETGRAGAPRRRGRGHVGRPAAGSDACRTRRESGSRKRKAAVRDTESDDLTNEGLNMPPDDSWRISKEIENLTSQLAKKKKELRYSQEVKKLKAELSLNAKDMECLMKQNEELKSKNKNLQNSVVGLERQIEAKNRRLLQMEGRTKTLELSNAGLEEDNRKLQRGNNAETCCIMNPQTCSPSQIASQENNIVSSELQSKRPDSMSKSPDESSYEKCAGKKVDDGRMVSYHLLDPYYEKQHRAPKIESGEMLQVLRLRTHEASSIMPYDDRYTPLLRRANLAGVANVVRRGMPSFNTAALTALVDRWRPETHTFHLPCGEMTVTLQDVAMILALPIRGEPVTGRVVSEGWRQRTEDFLGRPFDAHGKSHTNGVPLSWLRSNFSSCPPDADANTLTFYARAWVLHMFGSVLFPDGGGDTASWMYIPCLLDWDQAGTYSWGSAVLGFLYRQLCEACRRTAPSSTLAGCIFLLQVWMWERLPVGRPLLRQQRAWYPDTGQDLGPTASYLWDSVAPPHGRSHAMYLSYTNELDVLSSGQVEWQPYTKPGIQNLVLNSMCRRDEDLWMMRCPLICFYVVEFHLPHRGMRQFNKIQSSPPEPFSTSIQLHKFDRRRQKKIDDFLHYHRQYIDEWRRYETNVVRIQDTHRDKEFGKYLDWLHTAARVRLRPAWTEDDYASGDEDNPFDAATRAGTQVEIAPILDRVGRDIKQSVDEAEMALQIVPGEPNEASHLRQCVERIQINLRRVAARVGCRMRVVGNLISPVQASPISSRPPEDSGICRARYRRSSRLTRATSSSHHTNGSDEPSSTELTPPS